MKKTLATVTLTAVLASSAYAQIDFVSILGSINDSFTKILGALAGGATERTQIANNIQLLAQAAIQAKMLTDMIKNSAQGRPAYGNTAAELQAVANLIQIGQAISYSTANADVVFRQRFPGYGPPVGGTYYDQYRIWSQTSLDTVAAVLRGIGYSHSTLSSNAGNLAQILRANLSSADGRLLATQALGAIADNQTTQLEHLRSLMMLDIQGQAAVAGYQLQRDATATAMTERFFNFSARPLDTTKFQAGP